MNLSEYFAGSIAVLNKGGEALRQLGIDGPSLEADDLIRVARHRSGLVDLGAWPIDEPLGRLLDAYRSEAKLTTVGRLTAREMFVGLLQNLLHMESERSRHPEVEDESIRAPVFIASLPRTGTTFLHNLMTEDPATRVPLTWEVTCPTEFPNNPVGHELARRHTANRLRWANRLIPEFKRIHAIDADLPQECVAITAPVFMSIQFFTTHNVPSYQDWFERDSQELTYRFHRRMLQHLQFRQPGNRWLLKAPAHLFSPAALLRQYPDAKLIQTHRDPVRAMTSMASHATVLRRAFSDDADPRQIAADWLERWARALDDFLEFRDRHPDVPVLDVDYDAFVAAPEATVERIYDWLGWPLTPEAEAAMRAYVAANPRNKHGKHRYSVDEYGLDRAALERRFAAYCDRFGVGTA